MSKQKKKIQIPGHDKKITIDQAYSQMQDICLQLETVVLITLNKEFGFGEKRKERFMEAFRQEMNSYLLTKEREMRRL